MPSVLHTFPAISRSGHQETGFVAIPAGMQEIQITGQASDAVKSDPTNGIMFTVYRSPDGQVGTRQPLFIDYWWGNVYANKFPPPATVVAPIDVTFGPLDQYVGQFVQLAVDFTQPMIVGATLTAWP